MFKVSYFLFPKIPRLSPAHKKLSSCVLLRTLTLSSKFLHKFWQKKNFRLLTPPFKKTSGRAFVKYEF